MGKFITFGRIAASAAIILIAACAWSVHAGITINGREVTPYVGRIVSHNEKTGEIVVRTARSTRRWTLGRRAAAFYGKDRVQLAVVWHRSQQVRVHVSNDGEVQRITVLSWK